MKNKVFVSVPITQEIKDKLEDLKYYHTVLGGEPDFDLGRDIKATEYLVSAEILLEQPSLPIEGKTAEEKFNTNSEIGSHHWFQTLIGQCIRMGEFIETNPDDKRILEFEYGKKIKETLAFVSKNFKSINTIK